MSQLFNKIKVSSTSRSTFDLSHTQITTSDFGYLIPVMYRDMIPNDDFVFTPSAFCRLAPLACPTFANNMKVRFHHFFVPYRILYGHWDNFITQDPNNSTVPPYFTVSGFRSTLIRDPQYIVSAEANDVPRGTFCKLLSNLGLNPVTLADSLWSGERIAAFPFLAYYRIWLDYFMDSSLNDHSSLSYAFTDSVRNGGSLDSLMGEYLKIRNCCFKKDYFTTAKLNPQDGNPSSVNVDVNPDIMVATDYSGTTAGVTSWKQSDGSPSKIGVTAARSSTTVGQFTIEALRAANSLQRYLERNNFVGTKLINRIFAHFGIEPQAERLDMAEYIGGSSFPIRIGDVTSTNAVTESTVGLGYKAGQGVGSGKGETCRYHAKEHGILMSVMSVIPDTSYYQGMSRFWQKGVNGDALDYFHPEFENLGYQEILNKEVYIPDVYSDQYQQYDGDGIFGYSPRYSEYKFQQDILGSDFVGRGQSYNFGSAMDSFHTFRKLVYDDENPLALNNNFVELNNNNNDFDRIFQVVENNFDHFLFDVHFDVKATRPMSGFGEPSLDVTNTGDGHSVNLPYGGTRL